MSDFVDQMVVSVRADTTAFARDVAEMRGQRKDRWRAVPGAPG